MTFTIFMYHRRTYFTCTHTHTHTSK